MDIALFDQRTIRDAPEFVGVFNAAQRNRGNIQ
jgi:hypothetical protein